MNKNRTKRKKIFNEKKSLLTLQESINKDDLHCVICMDYPNTKEIFQCKNSHLLCADCHSKIAENENCVCPTCRIKLSRDNPCRSRLAESIISKLIVFCPNQKCGEKLYNENLKKHQREQCSYRSCKCKFFLLGCDWKGIAKLKRKHEKSCPIRSLDASAILKNAIDRSREREIFERKKALSIDSERRLVAMLSQRHRNVLIRDLTLYKKSGDNILFSSCRISAFGVVLALDLIKEKILKNGSDSKDSLLENSKPGTNQGEKGQVGAKRSLGQKNGVAKEQKNDDKSHYIRGKFSCVRHYNKKIRLEGFLLAGPQFFCRFRPAHFRLTVKENAKDEVFFTMPFDKSQIEELSSVDTVNLRILLFNRENGVDSCFVVNRDYSYMGSERYSEEDDIYDEYSDELDEINDEDYDVPM